MNQSFECLVEGCKVRIPAVSGDMHMLLFQTYNKDTHGALQVSLEHRGVGETGPKAQKIENLCIPDDCSEVQWGFSFDKWENFKGFYKLTNTEEISSHIRSCCSDSLQ